MRFSKPPAAAHRRIAKRAPLSGKCSRASCRPGWRSARRRRRRRRNMLLRWWRRRGKQSCCASHTTQARPPLQRLPLLVVACALVGAGRVPDPQRCTSALPSDCLNALEEEAKKSSIEYIRIDGSTPSKCAAHNANPSPATPAFPLTKAGVAALPQTARCAGGQIPESGPGHQDDRHPERHRRGPGHHADRGVHRPVSGAVLDAGDAAAGGGPRPPHRPEGTAPLPGLRRPLGGRVSANASPRGGRAP